MSVCTESPSGDKRSSMIEQVLSLLFTYVSPKTFGLMSILLIRFLHILYKNVT